MIKDVKKGSLFLKTMAVVKANGEFLAVDDSMLVDRGFKLLYRTRRDILEFQKTSRCSIIIRKAKDCIALNPVNNLGLVILIAVMTNITLSLLLTKEFGFVSWFMRVNLILIGTVWVSCKVELNDLKKTSLCYKLIIRRSK